LQRRSSLADDRETPRRAAMQPASLPYRIARWRTGARIRWNRARARSVQFA